MWLKYSDAPIVMDYFVDQAQPGRLSAYEKPRGCWITDDSEHCWRSWCVGEQFGVDGLSHKHEVTLDERDILILRSAFDLDAFTDEFAAHQWWGPPGDPRKYRELCINWPKVAERYTGLIITPYQWSRRLDAPYSWYYGWDCASGCIWKASAIKDVRLIEVDAEIAKSREAA